VGESRGPGIIYKAERVRSSGRVGRVSSCQEIPRAYRYGGSRAHGNGCPAAPAYEPWPPEGGEFAVANGQQCGTGMAGAAAIETNDDGGVAESSKGRRLMKPTTAVGPKVVHAAVCMQSGQRRRSAWAA
jgi:hypothetical protein